MALLVAGIGLAFVVDRKPQLGGKVFLIAVAVGLPLLLLAFLMFFIVVTATHRRLLRESWTRVALAHQLDPMSAEAWREKWATTGLRQPPGQIVMTPLRKVDPSGDKVC